MAASLLAMPPLFPATPVSAQAANSPATGLPTISGTVQVSETLTADTSAIADEDGLNDVSYSYQWSRKDGNADTDIEDATDSMYTLVTADQGKTTKVKVSFTDDAGNAESLTSAATATVANADGCTRAAPTPVRMQVEAVPITVESTTEDYFVLYVRHGLDANTTFEVPVRVTLGQDGATTLTESLEALPRERYRVEKYLVSDPADVDGDCTDDITELADPVGMNPLNPVPAMSFDDGAAAIPNRETYVSLAYKGASGIDSHLRNLEAVKFHMVDMDTDRPSVYFMNTKTYRRHDDFQGAVGLEVNPLHGHETMVGEMVYHPKAVAPDGSLGVYRFQFGANDVYSFKELSYAFTVLAASMPLLEDNLAYYPMWERAVARYHEDQSLYDDSRVDVLLAEDIAFDLDFITLNRGEGFGFLRVMSREERPNPRDIVIYETLPNDLSRVAGIITTVPQTPLSHVNLRAVQDGVPNSFIRDALEDGDIDGLIGSYVQYLVGSSGYFLRAATPEEVDAHYEASRPAETQTPERDLTVTETTALSDIEFEDWNAFGVKAANVAVLRTLGFPDGAVPDGFAVPFYFYDEFMKHNGFYDDVEEMLADPDFQSDFETQEKELKKLRKKIKKGETPEWIIAALTERHAKYPEGQSLRYRSSTNNEDLPGFSGAGLYDSKTQKPDETEEDGIDKSLKQVYASLWNFRAFTEREFHRVDHSAAAMGVLVHPNYTDELANGVAVSFDPFRNRYGSYYVNTQVGEDLVTNPEANSVPEELLLYPSGTYRVLAYSNQVESGELLMSDAQIDQLRRHLEVIHDAFEELYDIEDGEPFAMEIEFKITSDDILSIKQARPWVFGDDAPSENSPATGAPTISGTAQVNETLTADPSGIADADGLISLLYGSLYSYQWIRNDGTTETDISNAASSTYTLSDADVGKTIRVRVSFTDDRGYEEALTSAPTTAVQPRPNSPETGLPTIIGKAETGETLTADTSGITDADGLTNVSYAYQWIANDGTTDTDIENAMAATYTLVTADEGKTIKVKVSFTDDANNSQTLTSAATPPVTPRNSPATGAPTISGTAQVGETLTADVSGIVDADGLTSVSYSYQWIANDASTDTDISGQTGSTYTLVSADVGKTIKVRVGFTDDANNSETLTSDATATVPTADEWWADMLVVDYGTGAIGAASADLFSNSGGNAGLQAKWLWFYSPERKLRLAFTDNVPSVNDLTLLVGDVALALQGGDATFTWEDVDVDWEDGQTLTARIVRDWTSAVVALNSPATGLPTIIGTAQAGETLTADVSGVNDADGLTNVSYSYQWIANDGTTDTEIHDATDSTYTLTDDDAGKTIKVRVSFTDDAGNEETLTSAVTAAVAARPNSPATGLPSIGGTPQVDQTLTADTTGIADEDGLTNVSYTYQWIANDADIEGATNSTYTLADSDEGKAIKVKVSFTDDADNEETLTSVPAAAVAARPNSPATGAPTITGTAQVGETLRVDLSGIADDDGLDNAVFSYQWIAGDADIGGATNSTYTLADGDEGKAIRVRVSYNDDAGNEETLSSAATGAVMAAANNPATGQPTISGTAQVGEILTSDISGIADEDGMNDAVFAYQWLADDAIIQSATNSTYTLANGNQGKAIRVKVSFTDDAGNEETMTSAATAAVAATPPPALSGGICDRTQQVQDEILGKLPNISDCASVTNSGLSGITGDMSLADSGVGALRAGDFLGLSGLKGLYLSDNGLNGLPPGVFDDLSNLAILDLAVNDLAALPADVFEGLDSLQRLRLFSNDLSDLSADVFDGLDKLQNLALSHNDLTELPPGVFDDLSNLTSLYMHDNDLNQLPGSAFEGLSSLEAMWLRDNPGSLFTFTAELEQRGEGAVSVRVAQGAPFRMEVVLSAQGGTLSSTNVTIEAGDIASETIRVAQNGDEPVTVSVVSAGFQGGDHNGIQTGVGESIVLEGVKGGNTPATGLPTISGTPQVDETLTADISGIADSDGLDNVTFRYQWVSNDGASDTDIQDATGSSYTLTSSEEGETIQVRVDFEDDEGNSESLTSVATEAVAAKPDPLTVSVTAAAPATHDGSSEFTFDIEFSEEVKLSYVTLKNHAFNVTGGSVEKAQRKNKPSNISWRITVKPHGTGDVVIQLPATTDCGAQGAICTGDGRMLSNSLSFTVSGPEP